MARMTYDGYEANVEYDEEAGLFHGEVAGLRDVITFQARSAADVEQALRDSVDDYRAFCAERGEMAERP